MAKNLLKPQIFPQEGKMTTCLNNTIYILQETKLVFLSDFGHFHRSKTIAIATAITISSQTFSKPTFRFFLKAFLSPACIIKGILRKQSLNSIQNQTVKVTYSSSNSYTKKISTARTSSQTSYRLGNKQRTVAFFPLLASTLAFSG